MPIVRYLRRRINNGVRVAVLVLVCFLIAFIVNEYKWDRRRYPRKQDPMEWMLCSKRPLSNAEMYPTIGNGHIATVVHSNSIFMNGLYNGKGTQSARARIPGLISVNITKISDAILQTSYCLHIYTGMYIERYIGNHWSIAVKMYAHRSLTRLLVTEVLVQTDGQQPEIEVSLSVNRGNESADITFESTGSDVPNATYMHGSTNVAETPSSERAVTHIYYTPVTSSLLVPSHLQQKKKYLFLASISPFKDDAKSSYLKGLQQSQNNTLESSHIDAWKKLWSEGRIDMYGNSKLASLSYSLLYYILSSIPIQPDVTWPFIGLSPGDLAHGNGQKDYMGHVFWDQDTWMFPAVLALYATLGKTLVNTRIRTLNASVENAKLRGYKGAMFVWESAFTGMDVTPSKECGHYEIHITGDVALGFQQYLMMTDDIEILTFGKMKEAIFKMADFWKSKVVFNDTKKLYEIHDVMPPDEYHSPVNNSVYTNSVAKIGLMLPTYVANILGQKPPAEYDNIASNMYIPFDKEKQYHPEYDGYKPGTVVKQADVILLGFPLDVNLTREQRRNDLDIFEKATPAGPAMSWSMFCIGRLELGQTREASVAFNKQLQNNQPPFNVWTENADGSGATNFITGQGGFLQSILFGYAGLRIHSNHIIIKCSSIPDTTGFTIVGLDYKGNSLDISCSEDLTTITLRSPHTPLYIGPANRRETIRLKVNTTLYFPNNSLKITTKPGERIQSDICIIGLSTSFHCLLTSSSVIKMCLLALSISLCLKMIFSYIR